MVYRDNSAKYWLILVVIVIILVSGATLWISNLYRQLDEKERRIGQAAQENVNTTNATSTNFASQITVASIGLPDDTSTYVLLSLLSIAGLGSGVAQALRRKSEREAWGRKVRELELKLQNTTAQINQLQTSYRAIIWSENAKSKLLEHQLREVKPDVR
jgi:hypothetical protein